MENSPVALFLGALLSSTVWAGVGYSVEVIHQPDQKWRIQRTKAYAADEGIIVSGRLTSRLPGALPRGHVDVAAYSPSGLLIAEITTAYVPAVLTHKMKKKGGVRFSTAIDQPLPDGAVIKVAFHRDPPLTSANPSHSGNVAK